MVSAGQLQPKGGLMAQADRLGPEVDGHLALWAAFISPRPCNDSVSRVVLRRVRNCRSYYYYYYYSPALSDTERYNQAFCNAVGRLIQV